jgi:cyclohexadienyl dehydratase
LAFERFVTAKNGTPLESTKLPKMPPMRAVSRLFALALTCALSYLPTGSMAESRLVQILSSQTVRVCIWPDYYGISYRNPKTQQLSGIDIDMAAELGKDLGVTVTFVDSAHAKVIDDLNQGRCDVAMFAVGVTPERIDQLRFTQPYLQSDIYAVTTRGNRRIQSWQDIDQPGTVVAVMKGTLHEPVMRRRLKAAQLLTLDSPFAREQEVRSGRADVFMTDFPYSQRLLATSDWARLITPPAPFHITPYAYAVKLGDDSWYVRMERFVSDIQRDGRLKAAAQRHRLSAMIVAPP